MTDPTDVPWNYNKSVVTYKGKEISGEVQETNPTEKYFNLEEVNNARKRFPSKKLVSSKEAEAFFQKMKMVDYEVLIKNLNEAYVPVETSVEQLERMAERFFAINQISFSKNDLPPEGAAHNKALHLTVKCKGYYVKRVMLDEGFGVDICPLSTLQHMEIDTERNRPNNVCVRAFDGIKRDTIGEIDLILTIGPVDFEITFQVLDMDTSYNFLLGRLWIHAAGAVPSTLHQMVKFEHKDQEIVCEEGKPCPQPFLYNASIIAAKEMIKHGYKPGKGLGKSLQGIAEPITLTASEKWADDRKSDGWVLPQPVPHLYKTFVKPKYNEKEEDKAFTTEEIEEICGAMRKILYEAHMVQPGEDSSTAEVLYMGPNAKLQNRKATPFPIRRESRSNNAALNNMTCLRTSCPDPNTLSNCEIMNQEPKYDKEEAFREINRELEQFENKPKSNLNDTEPVNLGSSKEIKETKISIHTDGKTQDALIQLLFEFKDVFAWSYDDMPGLSVDLVVHKLSTYPDYPPFQQKQRKFKTNISDKIKEEVMKQLKVGVIRVVRYTTWLANVVPVPKKDGKTRVCVDYRDLNKASPKDNFPLPNIHILVDNYAKYEIQSFVDCYAGYHQLNPAKCAFGVPSGKLLGFVVSQRGIELYPTKIKSIQDLPPPKTKKYVMSLLGRLNYISRFIAQLTSTCEPIFKLLKKDAAIKWTNECQEAFDKIKEYLSNPPVLVPPEPGRPLFLYLTVLENYFGYVLGQHDVTGKKEQAIYYMSKKFTSYEAKYTLLERTCCALTWVAQKLRHYLQDEEVNSVEAISKDTHAWKMFFDGVVNAKGVGTGEILISPTGQHYLATARLQFFCTNNTAKYEACIMSMNMAIDQDVEELIIMGDSDLIIRQAQGEWET
ncbi:uncharacterized protein [Nicotiana sylvestris]|uniref:uncharacterized protein n=1 Tax=Nicotiana sylvestris TaxID=4096 RepID=UPI00388C4B10